MTNDTRYQAYRNWLSVQTMDQAGQTLDSALGDRTYLKLLWDMESPNEWAWLAQNLIRSWEAEFGYKNICRRIWINRVAQGLAQTPESDPWAFIQLSPGDSCLSFGDLDLPSVQGQLTLVDQGVEIQLGTGLWLTLVLTPASLWSPPTEPQPGYTVQQPQKK